MLLSFPFLEAFYLGCDIFQGLLCGFFFGKFCIQGPSLLPKRNFDCVLMRLSAQHPIAFRNDSVVPVMIQWTENIDNSPASILSWEIWDG